MGVERGRYQLEQLLPTKDPECLDRLHRYVKQGALWALGVDGPFEHHLAASADSFQCAAFHRRDAHGGHRRQPHRLGPRPVPQSLREGGAPLTPALALKGPGGDHQGGHLPLLLRRPPRPGLPGEVRPEPEAGVPPDPLLPRFRQVGRLGEGADGFPHRLRDRRPLAPSPAPTSPTTARPVKPLLKADKAHGTIFVDTRTTLTAIPSVAWDYRLGNRSALEWILDQHKEKKPKDPTIREKFNTYRCPIGRLHPGPEALEPPRRIVLKTGPFVAKYATCRRSPTNSSANALRRAERSAAASGCVLAHARTGAFDGRFGRFAAPRVAAAGRHRPAAAAGGGQAGALPRQRRPPGACRARLQLLRKTAGLADVLREAPSNRLAPRWNSRSCTAAWQSGTERAGERCGPDGAGKRSSFADLARALRPGPGHAAARREPDGDDAARSSRTSWPRAMALPAV